jgi:invasion protein IalB
MPLWAFGFRFDATLGGEGPMFRGIASAFAIVLAAGVATSVAWAEVPLKLAQSAKPAKPTVQANAPANDTQPTLLGQYGDWGAYSAAPGGSKTCFALAKPKVAKTDPPGRKRDQAYVFVSTRPAENVKDEVSVIVGYPFKASSDATAEIGSVKFEMYTQNDGAWIKNVAEEARMVEAMRKGAELVIRGTSGRGAKSTDQYSLKGLTEALARVEQECK